MAFERKPHWLLQVFGAAVDQTYEHLTRKPDEKLFDACMTGKYLQVKRLINSGKVDINQKDPWGTGQTPLMYAVNWGNIYATKDADGNKSHRKIVAFLLTKSPDLTVVDTYGNTVWECAEKNKELLALLPPRPGHLPPKRKPAP